MFNTKYVSEYFFNIFIQITKISGKIFSILFKQPRINAPSGKSKSFLYDLLINSIGEKGKQL